MTHVAPHDLRLVPELAASDRPRATHAEEVRAVASFVAEELDDVLTAIIGYAELSSSAHDNGDDPRDPLTRLQAVARRGCALAHQLRALSQAGGVTHPLPKPAHAAPSPAQVAPLPRRRSKSFITRTFERPAYEAPPVPTASPSASAGPVERDATILLIVANSEVAGVMRAVLATAGYSVLVAHDGQCAIELAETFKGRIELVVMDQSGQSHMPTVTEIHRLRSDIKIVTVTEHIVDDVEVAPRFNGLTGRLVKPIEPGRLIHLVERVLGGA